MSLHLAFVGVSDLAFCSSTTRDKGLMRHLQEIATWRRGTRLPSLAGCRVCAKDPLLFLPTLLLLLLLLMSLLLFLLLLVREDEE